MKEIPRKYLGMPKTGYKTIPAWVAIAAKNLTPFIDGNIPNWTSRSEVVSQDSIMTLRRALSSRFRQVLVVNLAGYYTPSVVDGIELFHSAAFISAF